MSRTDKDVPAKYAEFNNEVQRRYGKSRNYAKAMRFEKKRGHRNLRRGKEKFWDVYTCRTWRFYY